MTHIKNFTPFVIKFVLFLLLSGNAYAYDFSIVFDKLDNLTRDRVVHLSDLAKNDDAHVGFIEGRTRKFAVIVQSGECREIESYCRIEVIDLSRRFVVARFRASSAVHVMPNGNWAYVVFPRRCNQVYLMLDFDVDTLNILREANMDPNNVNVDCEAQP